MKPYLVIATLDNPAAEPFVVLSVDPTDRVDGGCRAIVISTLWTRAEAEAAITQDRGEA